MEEYGFSLNSTNDLAKPVGLIKNKKNDIIDLVKDEKRRIFDTNDEVVPIFYTDKEQNIRIYISGQSGCGKSYLTSQIMESYKKIYDKKNIFVFSTLEDDPAYDKNPKLKNKFVRYILNNENAELLKEIKEEDLANSLVVFDDFLLFEPKLKKIVDALKDILLKRGRHYGIDTIIINDKILDGHKTKTELNQSNYVIVFPTCTNKKQLENFLDNYLGLEPNIIKTIKKLPSRWVCLAKNYPRYAIYQHGAFMLT